jgi:uncharacterized RDD family membrane protein YckC
MTNASPLVDPTAVVRRRLVAGLVDAVLVVLVHRALLVLSGSSAASLLVVAILVVAYFGVVQGFTGATLGKVITGVRVVNPSGRPPGPAPALVRTAALAADAFFGIGLWLAWSTPSHRRLGDALAGTLVVDEASLGVTPPLHWADDERQAGDPDPAVDELVAELVGASGEPGMAHGRRGSAGEGSDHDDELAGGTAHDVGGDRPHRRRGDGVEEGVDEDVADDVAGDVTEDVTEDVAEDVDADVDDGLEWVADAGADSDGPGLTLAPALLPSFEPLPAPIDDIPQWDAARGAYVQYDPVSGRWMQYDYDAGDWRIAS